MPTPLRDTAVPEDLITLGSVWILAGQVNLYRRVNSLWMERYGGGAQKVNNAGGDDDINNGGVTEGVSGVVAQGFTQYSEAAGGDGGVANGGGAHNSEPPLYAWWALLPPPLDVVVGLRQARPGLVCPLASDCLT